MNYIPIVICSLLTSVLVAQKNSLSDIIWQEAGGRIDLSKDHGGQYEIVDDSKNGYVKIAYTEEGCGCYIETVIGAYKDANGKYTTLKSDWNGCEWGKTLSAKKGLSKLLPDDFGLHTFLPKSEETVYQITSAMFYLEAEIPRKGTDTRLDLTYIPFGIEMAPEDHVLTYGYEQIGNLSGSNFLYSEELQAMLHKISDENPLECILELHIDAVAPEDKNVIEKILGEGKPYPRLEELAAQIHKLKTLYKISKDIKYKSVILGWDRDKARFFVKEKIKNDTPELSFLDFIRQLPFLKAIC